MNLQNLNLVELNAQEVQSIDGGLSDRIGNEYGSNYGKYNKQAADEFIHAVSDFLRGFFIG